MAASSKTPHCGQGVALPRPIIRHRKRRYPAFMPILPSTAFHLSLLCFVAIVSLFKENPYGAPGQSYCAPPCMFAGFNHPIATLNFSGCAAQLISGPPILSFAISLTILQRRSAMWIPRMTLTQRSHMLLYLMLAGDIHPHPGPRPGRRRARRKPKHPLCPTCSQKVGKCASVTSAAYQSLENDGDV